jgi:hypothetical protein
MYITRNGKQPISITRIENKTLFPIQAVFTRKNGSFYINEYRESGRYINDTIEHPEDLIEDVLEHQKLELQRRHFADFCEEL